MIRSVTSSKVDWTNVFTTLDVRRLMLEEIKV